MIIKQEVFGKNEKGEQVCKYIVEGKNVRATFCETGATIMSLEIRNKSGDMTDVVLGLSSNEEYMKNWAAFGAVIGRCANRINGAKFSLNGKQYKLKKNTSGGCLHSGYGYQFRKWNGSFCVDEKDNAYITFEMDSEDGDQGFPGNLKVRVQYTVSEDRSLTIKYDYVSDMDTVVNLTNHCYFNLDGHNSGTVLNHRLLINASEVTGVDKNLMPTGEILPVEKTAYDFRSLRVIKDNMNKDFKTISNSNDYDINYVINDCQGEYRLAATLEGVKSKIGMRVYTDMPGMQVYTANALNKVKGKNGAIYSNNPAICFETQFYPDAININHFPSPVVKAGEKKSTVTKFEFYDVDSNYNFFAMISRMKYINRWGLMQNTIHENIAEHSLEVAIIAHALAVINNVYFDGNINSEKVAVAALFHDVPEIITGDLPTPVKYFNPEIKKAYKVVEDNAIDKLLSLLPEKMKPIYEQLLREDKISEECHIFVKAADKISALIKCVEEKRMGNLDFLQAEKEITEAIRGLNCKEANFFMEKFLQAYSLTLDEQA